MKKDRGGKKRLFSLTPVAVLPEFQKQGIGGEFVKEGLKAARGPNTILS
ncbi:TPA: hypothetical protein HA338_10910 [Methanosarcina acetivorans]|uniref:N-acetyltransferase domain-containing protein n=1 Tax=Methanosarcina acetivorans TaxID=2214 RepID=A0A832WA86_9EURY|nr:hypothetical protein [Methanosarcina acetivorans]HIH94506.1 hypothetical protein [Methanosarcina acetivorans]